MKREESADPQFVRAINLSRRFTEGENTHDVLRNLNVEIARGELVALRGRSGSGKSTLLNILSGIDIPDSGEVFIAGENISAMSETQRTVFRRRNIGFVYQAFNLVPTLSVANNIRLVLELNGTAIKEADARISQLLEAVGLSARSASFPDVLSGGEQQRVAIARALAHKPRLLLADEPTGNLDDQTAAKVLMLLGSLVRDAGTTMIVATHSAHVASVCDRILELRDGCLRH